MGEIRYESDQKTVMEIVHYFENGQLNLNPGFQRESVWTISDRRKLIDSILRNYPLPSIFLYRREENGELIYDVLDGKQRLESILMFMGQMRGARFEAKAHLNDDSQPEWIDWKLLLKRNLQHKINGYKLATTEVRGELSDIIDLFVRINSTGKALTKQEQRKARYATSEFLKKATQLAFSYENYFLDYGICSPTQISRQKHVELACELMVSAAQQDIINKKAVLDKVMVKDAIKGRELTRVIDETRKSLNRTSRIFPDLKSTRFNKQSDFYSLAVLIQKFEREKKILIDRKRNRLADDLLTAFSIGVDNVREKQKKIQNISQAEELESTDFCPAFV